MTIEEKSNAYAETRLRTAYPNMTLRRFDKAVSLFDTYDMAQAYKDGATEALASQWKDPKVELPEDEETVLTLSSYGPVLAYYSKQDETWFAYGNYGDITPTHWLPIPPLKGGSDTFDETDK